MSEDKKLYGCRKCNKITHGHCKDCPEEDSMPFDGGAIKEINEIIKDICINNINNLEIENLIKKITSPNIQGSIQFTEFVKKIKEGNKLRNRINK